MKDLCFFSSNDNSIFINIVTSLFDLSCAQLPPLRFDLQRVNMVLEKRFSLTKMKTELALPQSLSNQSKLEQRDHNVSEVLSSHHCRLSNPGSVIAYEVSGGDLNIHWKCRLLCSHGDVFSVVFSIVKIFKHMHTNRNMIF